MTHRSDLRGLDDRLVVDTSEGKASYLLVGKNGSYMKLSSSAYHLLQAVHAGLSFDDLAQRLSEQKGRPIQAEEVERAYQHVISNIEKIEGKARQDPFGFWFRMTWIPAAVVGRIARVLAGAFHPVVATVLIASSATFVLSNIQDIPEATSFLNNDVSFWSVYLLVLLSVLIHEFGHASACARFGGKPSDIGFSFYWIFPVLYSDVSDVWRLRRWQRVVVDLSGIYFQFLAGAVYFCGSVLFGWTAGKYAMALILYGFFVTLNPILKFDGYWIIADALGVVNLWQQPARIVRHFSNRLKKRPTARLPWSRWVTVFVAIYTPLTVGFWLFFMTRVLAMIWGMSHNYPAIIQYVFYDLFHPPYRFPFERLQYAIIPTLTILSIILTVFNLSRFLVRWLRTLVYRARKMWRSRNRLVPTSQQ